MSRNHMTSNPWNEAKLKLKTLLKHNVLNSLSTLYQYFTVLSAHGATDFVERLYECPMGKRISAPDVHFAQIGFKMPSKSIYISRQKLIVLFLRGGQFWLYTVHPLYGEARCNPVLSL